MYTTRQKTSIALAFVGFALTVAVRDVCYKWAFASGSDFATMAVLTGAVSTLTCLVVYGRTLPRLGVARPGTMAWRLLLNVGTWVTMLRSFELLQPSFISIVSKVGLPLLILMGPMLKTPYSRRERTLAVLVVAFIGTFALWAKPERTPAEALLWLSAAIALVLCECIFLSHSVRSEQPVFVPLVPSLAILTVGLALKPAIGPSPRELMLGAIAGVMFFGAYYSGLIRYRFLPPGLAEYPSLLTYFLILPVECLVLGGSFDPWVFTNALVVLSIMTALLREHARAPGNARAAKAQSS